MNSIDIRTGSFRAGPAFCDYRPSDFGPDRIYLTINDQSLGYKGLEELADWATKKAAELKPLSTEALLDRAAVLEAEAAALRRQAKGG